MAEEGGIVRGESGDDHHDLVSQVEVASLSDDNTHCLVCFSDLTIRGKTPCDHNDICGACHLRLRYLHGDKKCPICKASNDAIIVDSNAAKRFQDYPMWGDEIGAGFFHRSDVGMFFESGYYDEEILPLFDLNCNHCDFRTDNTSGSGKKNKRIRNLQDHLRSQHRLALCQLCVDHKRDFVSRLPRMTNKQLQNHLKNGDGPTSGFNGHPMCEFCKPKRFYDLAFLHQHLHKEHYKCHICEKQGLDNQFFKNYKSLERHFDQQHFLCHDAQCLAARFVVFENELDLRAHELAVHGGSSTGSTKINLEFRTRRVGYDGSGLEEHQTTPSESDFNYGLDGQAFVPDALPTSNQNDSRTTGNNRNSSSSGNSQLHPLHVQRTEQFRAHAATIREQQALQNQEESFPSLQSAPGASSGPLIGWAAGTTMQKVNVRKKEAGKVTEEDFPTLGPAPSAKDNSKRKALKGNLGATRRQFDAMTMTATRQPNWNSTAAAVPAPALPSNFLSSTPAVATLNRQEDLAPGNFPALGQSKGNQQARNTYKPAIHSDTDFPAMTSRKPAPKRAPASVPPSLSNPLDFPAPPTANRNKLSVRDKVMGGSRKQPPHQATSNILQAGLGSTHVKVTIEDMKASLGPNNFKRLKKLTKSFAEGQLSPEGYVDQSAALFERGYGDADFWVFLPSLLESCPNQQGSETAMNYMASLKRQQFTKEANVKSTFGVAAPPAPSTWGSGAGRKKAMMKPAPTTAARPLTQPVAARSNTVIPSKKKNGWGSSGAATVVRAKARPGSVGIAAASQTPQGGTATKFMAKQQKQQKKEQNNQTKPNGKTKKASKNELRALAFGK